MRKLPRSLALLLVLLGGSVAYSQVPLPTPTPTPDIDDGGVIKISTSLVQIDATVRDRSGRNVPGLTADDFEIYENGKQQKITNFSYVELPQNPAGISAPNALKSGAASAVPRQPGSLRPEQVYRTIALVVDDLGLSFWSMNRVRAALKKFVEVQMGPNDLVTIVKTSAGSGALQQFTSDKSALLSKVARLRPYLPGQGDTGLFSDPTSVSGDDQRISKVTTDTYTIGTLGALNYVIRGMGRLPGRKAVMLFSDGLTLYDTTTQNATTSDRVEHVYRNLVDLANRSSVVIYGVDVRGLVVPMPEAQDVASISGGSGKFGIGVGKTAADIVQQRGSQLYYTQAGLRSLSEQTGGFAIVNNNAIDQGIERVLNDQKGYYLLGFQPDESDFDPAKVRFNKLKVKVKRSDLAVRYRSGFYGIADRDKTAELKTPRQQIMDALTSPFGSSDLNLQLTSLFLNDADSGNYMRSLVYVDGRDIGFKEGPDGWQLATYDLVAMIFGENGTVVDELSRTETIKAKADTLKEIREKGFVATITFPIKKPGSYQMRVVMRDSATTHLGSASQYIEVPDLKRGRLALSSILLSSEQPDPRTEQNATGTPFQSDAVRDLARREFRAGTKINFGLVIYNSATAPNAYAGGFTMQYKIFQSEKEIFTSKELPIDPALDDDKNLTAEGSFNLGRGAGVGTYILQVLIKGPDSNGKRSQVTQAIDFDVVE